MKSKTINKVKEYFKSKIKPEHRQKVRNIFKKLAPIVFSGNLKILSFIYGTDKWGGHWYAEHYDRHLREFRKRKITLLEIGIGGHSKSQAGGSSLRMWKTYFKKGNINGVDIYDKTPHNEKRIKTFKGDEVDEKFLKDVIKEIGTPDIIIDDGSHITDHNIKTFEILFPCLAQDGIYIIEDTQTSYWPDFGGTSSDMKNGKTAMNYFKGLTDSLNYKEFMLPNYQPTYFDKNIVAISFYHNLIVIRKGINDEKSNRNSDVS